LLFARLRSEDNRCRCDCPSDDRDSAAVTREARAGEDGTAGADGADVHDVDLSPTAAEDATMTLDPNMSHEEAARLLCEQIKSRLLGVLEMFSQELEDMPRFARYATLEATRATMATMLRHVLSEEMQVGQSAHEQAQAICAAAVATLDEIVTPHRLN
jgi:hypothetical protein